MSALTVELQRWCLQQLSLRPDQAASELAVVSGDASFRCYYRLALGDGGSVIAVHAPPDKENNEAFANVQALLANNGARVPALLAWDKPRGFLLQEDFGDQLLLPRLTSLPEAKRLYGQALSLLVAMQDIALQPGQLPDYDAQRLADEMALFPRWFVAEMLGYAPTAADRQMLEQVFSQLIEAALSQPQVLVHRDFHSRNLMCLANGELGMIDFQDAVRGPMCYDLVSLLRDGYICWPQDQVRAWALEYQRRAEKSGLAPPRSEQAFLRDFDWMGLQRHLKVLGIFARLKLRDGKDGYLKDLPLVMAYTSLVARAYPEFSAFADWFESRLLPLAKAQSWYRDVRL